MRRTAQGLQDEHRATPQEIGRCPVFLKQLQRQRYVSRPTPAVAVRAPDYRLPVVVDPQQRAMTATASYPPQQGFSFLE